MKHAKCMIDKEYLIAEIDPKLFGSFIEQMGRAVYTGIYEPDHPIADEQGFRKDVLELVKQLHIPIVRYPGGNFVSGYNWTDGIGPKENRPTRLDLAWLSVEKNEFGIDEFVDWCKKADTEVMAAVNLGTGTPQEAGYMLEYCNHTSGTYWSDLRRKNGHSDPHNIKIWCLGNEMDGPWQIGAMNAEDYGKKARETAKIMKWVDPSVELVTCGSSSPLMPTYPEWDRVVLEHTYEHVDYLSLHRYYENEGNVEDFLASFVDMNDFIKTVASTADYVKAKTRSKKTLKLSFDEWNIWYQKKQTRFPWEVAPPILEDNYSLLDALVFGGMLCTLLNNADRVKMACLAQLVNVIAPIFTQKGGKAIKQAIYYPFQQVSLYGRGKAIQTQIACPKFESNLYGEAPIIQSAATYNEETCSLTLFVLNCDKEDVELTMDLRSFSGVRGIEHMIMDGQDLEAKNSFDEPNKVVPRIASMIEHGDKVRNVVIPKLSWNVLRFSTNGDNR
ncbi:alpha-N-arabinofuranosidase [Paenibacillus sp. V4I3]|uniref:arabinosylfuranosidase ArfA n=1 Tax=unclassified Paenibacillus TaxID=185978 RepID=UPI0027816B6E|nr:MULTISPECIES: alpha-N-arabinofuranosidase [unclassified Paenibacillus]MDQ0877373.1 alpha-N-arabinofuranosidase [Paenibacillus sp. V4I3]MDQ0886762.1 alpha-N-arabinofuranosidase [Paenibacillus sp. V4I9]